ncbi:MAG TPA: hypothetical protein VFZ78_09635, partial [Flavisolibacter sp.]
KKKFEMVIRQKLLNPMQMTKTSFANLDGSAPNPSGGAVSTANDYMKFLTMLLNNGMYNGKRILSEESVQEIRKIQIAPELMKYSPKTADGFRYALGSWSIEEKDGVASALTSPGLLGTFPVVDWCHGYACLFFVKTLLNEQKKDAYLQMKDAIDEELKSKCE